MGALGVALLAVAPLSLTAPATAAAPADVTADVTVEEGRLTQAAPQEILRRSGFDAVEREFGRGLARVTTYGGPGVMSRTRDGRCGGGPWTGRRDAGPTAAT